MASFDFTLTGVYVVLSTDFTDIVVVCCAHLTSRIGIYYIMILGIIPFLVGRFMALFHAANVALLPTWMRRFTILELVTQEAVTFLLFAGAVPSIFNEIDRRSRSIVKPRKRFFTFGNWFSFGKKPPPKKKEADDEDKAKGIFGNSDVLMEPSKRALNNTSHEKSNETRVTKLRNLIPQLDGDEQLRQNNGTAHDTQQFKVGHKFWQRGDAGEERKNITSEKYPSQT